MLLGSGVDAKTNDVITYPNFFLLRKFPIISRFDFWADGTNLLKKWLIRFRINLPIVAPVAPIRAKNNGSRAGSSE